MYPPAYKNEASRHTAAPPEVSSCCQHCQHKKSGANVEDAGTTTIISDYLSSLHYINSCHTLINQIIKSRQSPPSISMPQMPNFLNVLTYIAKDVRSLADLKNLEALETLMRDVNLADVAASAPSVGQSSQTSCFMADKEVDAYRLPCDDAETSMKRAARTDTRVTGIPRPIRTHDKSIHFRQRPSSSPLPPTNGYGDYNRFCCHAASNNVISNQDSTNPLTSVNEEKESSGNEQKVSLLKLEKRQSNAETTDTSTDETDDYAKKILLATDEMHRLSNHDRLKKVRRVRSKTTRDYAMIQGFLKQWGIDVPTVDNESMDDMGGVSCDRNAVFMKYNGDMDSEKSPLPSPNPIEVEVLSDSSGMCASSTGHKHTTSPQNSRVSSKCSEESTERINAFNSIAATAEGLENTFITNEKPVWQQMGAIARISNMDDSDIEPDSDQKCIQSKHMNIMRMSPRAAKTVTFQTNPTATYVVTQKPKDLFLMPRRRHSHSDVGSDHNLLQSSDIDDEVFDKKRRARGTIKVRQPMLPQKVLSNIGILTRTGQVKPEKERQLQELRSQLSTDMKSTLFRKPRNRKLETDDIIHLQNELATGTKK